MLEYARISIHTLRVESDSTKGMSAINLDISIHTLRVESDLHTVCLRFLHEISIHTLRVESDVSIKALWYLTMNFNPHSPCGE